MLSKARQKVTAPNVTFLQGDITKEWKFSEETFDLITFSLVLEHVEDLKPAFDSY
jgi:ubiquinone/menaquinone biosynthesis C-methylase UbiE